LYLPSAGAARAVGETIDISACPTAHTSDDGDHNHTVAATVSAAAVPGDVVVLVAVWGLEVVGWGGGKEDAVGVVHVGSGAMPAVDSAVAAVDSAVAAVGSAGAAVEGESTPTRKLYSCPFSKPRAMWLVLNPWCASAPFNVTHSPASVLSLPSASIPWIMSTTLSLPLGPAPATTLTPAPERRCTQYRSDANLPDRTGAIQLMQTDVGEQPLTHGLEGARDAAAAAVCSSHPASTAAGLCGRW
jgi:hypothetical protein